MALPSSGTISINNLKVEFSDTYPSSMSEFYRGGTLVPNIPANSSVPISGTIALSNFYGATSQDAIPDAFELGGPVTSASISSYYYSNTITVSGLTSGTSVSVVVSGGAYSKNGGAYTTASGTAQNGDTFVVRVLSSSSYSTQVSATLTIGGVSDSFSVTTEVGDSIPDTFELGGPVTNYSISTYAYSNTITVSGLSTGIYVTASVTGGQFSINSGAYTSSSTSVTNGDTIIVRILSSGSYSTQVSATLYVGSIQDTFFVTTEAADTTPSAFYFTDDTNVFRSTEYTSNSITVSGLSTGITTTVSISGGTYSKNGGGYTSSSTTAVNGDSFTVRVMSSGSYSTAANATLTIGGVSDTYTVTTLPQLSSSSNFPASFNINPYTNGNYASQISSGTATGMIDISISASSSSVSLSVGGTVSASGGAAAYPGSGFSFSASASGAIASYYITVTPSSVGFYTSGVGEPACSTSGANMSYANQTVTVPRSDSGFFSLTAPILSWAYGTGSYTTANRNYDLALTVTDIEGSSLTVVSSFSSIVGAGSYIF